MSATQKFIVWDWNGTLLDDTSAVLDCVNMALSRIERESISMELFRDAQIRPLALFYRAIGLNDADVERALAEESAIFRKEYEPMIARVPLREGAAEILALLRNHQISSIIVSNHFSEKIAVSLHERNIDHHFDEIIAYLDHESYGQGQRAPKGEKLRQHILEKGLKPSNAIIVGDTLEEIDIAREQGLISVAITGGIQSEARLRAHKPDYIIHSLHDLKPIMQERGFVS